MYVNYIRNRLYILSNSSSGPTLDLAPIPTLPKEYAKFANVFSKDNARKLLAYFKVDYIINLIDGAKPPFGRIYLLSKYKLSILREYLKSSLARE